MVYLTYYVTDSFGISRWWFQFVQCCCVVFSEWTVFLTCMKRTAVPQQQSSPALPTQTLLTQLTSHLSDWPSCWLSAQHNTSQRDTKWLLAVVLSEHHRLSMQTEGERRDTTCAYRPNTAHKLLQHSHNHLTRKLHEAHSWCLANAIIHQCQHLQSAIDATCWSLNSNYAHIHAEAFIFIQAFSHRQSHHTLLCYSQSISPHGRSAGRNHGVIWIMKMTIFCSWMLYDLCLFI